MTQIITRSTTLDNIESLKILSEIATNFRVLGKQEILDFLENNNWLVSKCLPVNAEKMVVTGKASSTAARMEISGIKTILNNPGTPQRFKGVNDDEKKTTPVKATGFAIQHRYSTIGIDLDLDVFAGIDSEGNLVTNLPDNVLEWIATHHPYALKIRGNRKRLTLVFGTSKELQNHLNSLSRHKFNFTLSKGTLQKVEVGFGNVNNTIFGSHPTAKAYQQIFPESGVLGQLSLESFKELHEILEEISLVVDKKHRSVGSDSGRTLLADANEILGSISNDVTNYVQMIDKLDLDVELDVSIREFLNPESIAVIEGRKYFDGSNYIEVDEDAEFSIGSGARFFTYFNVGSDVNAVAYLLDKCDIYFDKNEIDDIIDELWEHTDSEGNGSKADKYYQSEAITVFNVTATYPSVKTDYLSVLVKRIREELNKRVMDAVDAKKSKLKVETIQEVVEVMKLEETKETEELIDGSTENPEEKEDEVLDFGDIVDGVIEEFEEKSKQIEKAKKEKENKTLPDFPEALPENIKDYVNRKGAARDRAKSDDWGIFNPELREVLEMSNDSDVSGYSYGIMTQTLALLAGVGGHVTIKNTEYYPGKPEEALNPYRTPFIPFNAVVGESGVGKSQIRNSFHINAIRLVDLHQKLSDEDQEIFKMKFGAGKDNNKFKNSELDPATNKPKDPILSKVIAIVNNGAKTDLRGIVDSSANCVTDDATDAGYRDNLVAQKAQTAIRKATNGVFFPDAYLHPVTLYSDELNTVFKKMFDSSITYGGSPEFFMMRKDAGSMKIARGGYNFDFSRAGLAITGNLVTGKVKEYISRELKDGTDGVTPRFNFALLENIENPDHKKTEWKKSRKEDAKVDVAGIIFAARYASIHAKQLINSPYNDNTLNFSSEAQEEYGKFIEYTKKLKVDLIGKFGKAEKYLNSMFGKASSELAIYAGGVNLLNQITNLWVAAKKYLPDYEEMKKLLLSNDDDNLRDLGQQMQSALETVIGDFKWSLSITAEDIKNSAKIVGHHYDFIEYQLEILKTDFDGNMAERAKQASQERVIASVEGESFENESHIRKISEGISSTLQKIGGDKEFAVSEVQKNNYTVRKLIESGNKHRVYQVFNILVDIGILERTTLTANGNPKFKLLISIAEFNKKIPYIVAGARGC